MKYANKPTISIIIPTLNEEKYLPRLLESLRHQVFRSYEIIVSDGNSTDQTGEIAKNYNCEFISSKIKNVSHQRNAGAGLARGDILIFVDADCILPDKNFLSAVYNEFKQRGLDACALVVKHEYANIILTVFDYLYSLFCFVLQFSPIPLTPGACIVSKKVSHQRIRGFDESIIIGEDHDYGKRIAIAGKYRIIISRKIMVSNRRFKKYGTIKILFGWVYYAVRTLIVGPMRKKIDYKFGNFR